MNWEDKYNSFDYHNEKIREEKQRSKKPKLIDMGELIRDWNGNYWCKQLCGG